MRITEHTNKGLLRRLLCTVCCLFLLHAMPLAQPPAKHYKVKDGKMYIELDKRLTDSSLDSFIAQYDLGDLALKSFVRRNSSDSLRKMGWTIVADNAERIIISKSLDGFDRINDPGEKIIYTDKHSINSDLYPLTNTAVQYGVNKVRNRNPFAVKDSVVTFFLRGNNRAKQVVLSGTFSNWSPEALKMTNTDSGWIYKIRLKPGKHWYKFVLDGDWIVDPDNQLNENDGRGNMNSVYYQTNYEISLDTFSRAKRVYVAGSFNQWRPNELQLVRTDRGWKLPIYLAEGTYTYRFIVDGQWMTDPFNKDAYPNEFNDFNSVLRLGKPYLFHLDGYTDASKVMMVGSFNNWKNDELIMKKTATGWELPYTLGPGNYEYNFVVDNKWVAKNAQGDNGSGKRGNLYFIIAPNYTFRLKGYGSAKTVFLSGDFNNWSLNTFFMQKEGDDWVLPVYLSPGKHIYKFSVDGKWIIDPENKLWEQNDMNTKNSVIWIEP